MDLSIIAFWIFLSGIAGWGSFHFARRDRRSISFMKITIASVLLVMFGTAFFLLKLPPEKLGEGMLAHATLFIFWPMAAIGAPLCIGSIVGILMGRSSG